MENRDMKTLTEIKDQVAQEAGYKNWTHVRCVAMGFSVDEMLSEAAYRFAKAYAEEDRKDCAEKVCNAYVDPFDILNRPYPELK